MLATLADPPRESGWGFEWKWDGVRAVAYLDGEGGLRLLTRNDVEVSRTYPELGGLAGTRTATVIDGEIVAPDESGAPSFSRLQNRMHVREPTERLVRSVPVRYLVFDVMWCDGRDLTGLPYTRRRDILERLRLSGDAVDVPPAMFGNVSLDDLLQAARDHGLEGVIAKRLASRYQPGRRSPDWVKVPLTRTQEVVIVGWQPGTGRRAGTVGSLLLGVHDERGNLVYAGQVGTGFTDEMLRDLQARLRRLARPEPPLSEPVPPAEARNANWVHPVLVGEVAYRAWTRDRRLRHPSWRGLRPDRHMAEVRLPDRLR